MMYKNIDLEKIISTIIVEEFIVLTLLDERFFIPIDGLNSLVFEKNNIYINGTNGINYIIRGNTELLDSYKDLLLNEGNENNNTYFCSVKTIEKFKVIYRRTNP